MGKSSKAPGRDIASFQKLSGGTGNGLGAVPISSSAKRHTMTREQILEELKSGAHEMQMRQLFATLDAAQIERFFEQLQKHATDVALRLELATQRAELCGFVRKTS